jgi:Flp pilus assembly protein TadD
MIIRKFLLIYTLLMFIVLPPSLFAQDKPDALKEYRDGNYQNAVALCQEEIKNDPSNLESYVVMGWSLLKLGRYDEAASAAMKGQTLSRYDPRLVEILGEVKYFQGKNAEALKYFQQYTTLAPEGGRIDTVYFYMGELYIRLAQFRHADIALSTAVRYLPDNSLWWTRLGYARENAGEIDGAISAYERALTLDGQSVDAKRGLDRTRESRGNR